MLYVQRYCTPCTVTGFQSTSIKSKYVKNEVRQSERESTCTQYNPTTLLPSSHAAAVLSPWQKEFIDISRIYIYVCNMRGWYCFLFTSARLFSIFICRRNSARIYECLYSVCLVVLLLIKVHVLSRGRHARWIVPKPYGYGKDSCARKQDARQTIYVYTSQ